MKYSIISLIFLSLFFYSADAQVNSNAIGVRFGGSHYGHYGGEISYQLGMGDKNRLEFDLGLRRHRDWSNIRLSVIYHWVWNITGGLNWYVGPGASVGFFQDRHPNNGNDDYIGIAIGGQIGIEYDFNTHGAPILLSLDARPMWNFLGWYGGFGYGSALGVRYTF